MMLWILVGAAAYLLGLLFALTLVAAGKGKGGEATLMQTKREDTDER